MHNKKLSKYASTSMKYGGVLTWNQSTPSRCPAWADNQPAALEDL